jgi:hypothetical protein
MLDLEAPGATCRKGLHKANALTPSVNLVNLASSLPAAAAPFLLCSRSISLTLTATNLGPDVDAKLSIA